MAIYKDENKTKDGRCWYFRTYYTTLDGKKKQYRSSRYLTKKEAQDKERTFLLTLTDKVEDKNITFKEAIDGYIEFQKDKVKITTWKNYFKYCHYFNNLYNTKVSVFNITKFNIWKKEIDNTTLSTTYKNNIYKFLKAILAYLERYHNYNFKQLNNQITPFTNPNELKKEMKFWNYEEFKKFINEEKDLKYKAYFEILYYCGLRKGEANALNWNDIDFNKDIIKINKNVTLKLKGLNYVILPPKTKSSIRTLPLPQKLKFDLLELKSEYKKYQNFKEDWFVFGGLEPLADTTVQAHRDNCCKKANMEPIRIHDFRHSCVSLLINNGASIMLVAKYLGHSNTSTTLNTYSHMFKNELEDIVKVINNL